jgi:delta 1-pyrroline-5-carboxylate dehydrogenase
MMFGNVARRTSFPSGVRQLSANFRSQYGAFVNGQEVFPDSKQFFKVHAPATDEVLCEVASTDAVCLNNAVEVADKVFHSGVWSRSDVRYRANVLSQIAVNLKAAIPELLELEVAQTGRAVREMKAQVSGFAPLHSTVNTHNRYSLFVFLCSWADFLNGSTTSQR